METRRAVLKQLVFSAGFVAAFPDFASAGANDSALNRGAGLTDFYSRTERDLVDFLAGAILPRTGTPGALEAGVPGLLDQLYRTWASAQTQARHHEQLALIAAELSARASGGTAETDSLRREALASLDMAAYARPATNSALASYRDVKSLIVQLYYATEVGALGELHYVAIPGQWVASAPIDAIRRLE